MTFEEARAQFPVLERIAHLNAGSIGPLPRAAAEALEARLERDLAEGRSGLRYVEELVEARERVRSAIAAVLGTSPELVALTGSTSRGCQIVIAGLGLAAGDEVVTTDQEHFGLIGPLHASGARVVVVEADEDAVAAAGRYRVCSQWSTERARARSAVSETSRRRRPDGPPLLVDGAQSAGAIEVDLTGADFYTVSAQKWLCAPDPAGALFVRDPERLRLMLPSMFSQLSYEVDGSFVPKEGARRFDTGWIGAPALAGIAAALGVHPEWRYEGGSAAADRCRELLSPFVDVVTPRGDSTLVSFRPDRDPPELVASLTEQGVLVRELPGRNLVRVSCGWWTSDDDLRRLADGLRW